jgi:pilus assembly protein CpaB
VKKPLLPITLTILLALGAGIVTFLVIAGANERAMADQESATILVTQDAVPEGMTLRAARDEGLITETTIPADLRPATALGPINQVNPTLVALAEIPAGQTVMEASVGTAVEQSPAIMVPEGQMAVSVVLDDPAKVGAFLRPGSRVAIFDTFAVPGTQDSTDAIFETRPLLDDITVIAVGTVTGDRADEATEDSWSAQLVTVAVTQEQAQRLVHATRTGALHFALLGEGTVLSPTEGVNDRTLFS